MLMLLRRNRKTSISSKHLNVQVTFTNQARFEKLKNKKAAELFNLQQ